MRQEFISQKVRRFTVCNEEFYPFIEKVLMRLPEDICFQGLLDDSELEIVSFKPSRGFQLTFEKPIRSIIALNESMLNPENDREDRIVYGIVHEMAHKIIRKGRTGLLEMEAENLLIGWGFEEESKKVNYKKARLERDGYKMGYEWAQKQTNLKDFEIAYDDWMKGNLNSEGEKYLIEMGLVCLHGYGEDRILHDEETGEESFRKGLVFGIMNVLKETKTV